MKYLFFDIECANSLKGFGKIYSLGYIVADENMNAVSEAKDIIIDPDVEMWDWYVLKKILAYDKDFVERQKQFDKAYPEIKEKFEDPETVICGFSVKDDVGYLLDDCKRYGLAPFNIKFYDIQRLDAKIKGTENRKLQIAYNDWTNNVPEGMHRSDADAVMTFEIARAITKKFDKPLLEILNSNKSFSGLTDGFRYAFNGEVLESKEERIARKKAEREKKDKAQKEK